jgi:hypothetical protein
MNPAPDAELASVGEFYHNWLTKAVTDLVFRCLAEPRPEGRYRWDALLNPPPAANLGTQTLAAAASAAQSAADAIIPQAVRDLPSDVVSTVGDFVGQAAGVVSGIVGAVTEAATPEPEAQAETAPAASVETQPPPVKGSTKRPRTASSSKKGSTTKRAASTRSRKAPAGESPTEG